MREIITACAREWMEGGRGSRRPSEESEAESGTRIDEDFRRLKEAMAKFEAEYPELKLFSHDD